MTWLYSLFLIIGTHVLVWYAVAITFIALGGTIYTERERARLNEGDNF